jgi:hypothetical protein
MDLHITHVIVGEVVLTIVLYEHTEQTIIIVPLTLSSTFMSVTTSTSGRIHGEFVFLEFSQVHRKTDRFFAAAGVVQFVSSTSGQFHYRHATFSSQLNSKIGNILAEDEALCINLNIDGAPITSKSHTHPSHSQTCRLLTSSLSLGMSVPVQPRLC